jgi:hypothetical protein
MYANEMTILSVCLPQLVDFYEIQCGGHAIEGDLNTILLML